MTMSDSLNERIKLLEQAVRYESDIAQQAIEDINKYKEALKSVNLFLHHLWCDVQMNDYSFQKLQEQMDTVEKLLKE